MANATATPMTMTQKIIAIAVVIIIISSVALPVIDQMQQGTTETGSNTPLFRVGEITDANEHILSFSSGTATFDDYSVDMSSAGNQIMAVTDSIVVFHRNSSNDMRVYAADADTPYGAVSSITFENGTATWEISDTTYTKTYTQLYALDPNGNYGGYTSGTELKFNADSVLFGWQFNLDVKNPDLDPSTIRYISLLFKGTYNDMQSVILTTANEAVTESDGTVSLSAHLQDGGYYSFVLGTDATSTVVENDVGDYFATLGYALLAPITYTYSEELDGADLFGVVAIMLILVPVMMAVRMIALKRN